MDNEGDDLIHTSTSGLSASAMMRASPIQHGKIMKLHVPLFYSICPTFIKRLLSSWIFFSFFTPQWKERYLILIGKFLYKFKHDHSSSPKGSPFPVESIDVRMISKASSRNANGMEFELSHLPPGCQAVFTVSTLRKTHYYAVSSKEECSTWIASLGEARQEQIRRSMGHTGNMPYPKRWEYFDGHGSSLVKSKQRIKEKMEELHTREMEMTNFGDGGPMPRGYYG